MYHTCVSVRYVIEIVRIGRRWIVITNYARNVGTGGKRKKSTFTIRHGLHVQYAGSRRSRGIIACQRFKSL